MAGAENTYKVGLSVDVNDGIREIKRLAAAGKDAAQEMALSIQAANRQAFAGIKVGESQAPTGAVLARLQDAIPIWGKAIQTEMAKVGKNVDVSAWQKNLLDPIKNMTDVGRTGKLTNRTKVGGQGVFAQGVPGAIPENLRNVINLKEIRGGYTRELDKIAAEKAAASIDEVSSIRVAVAKRREALDLLQVALAEERAKVAALAIDVATTRQMAAAQVELTTLQKVRREHTLRALKEEEYFQGSRVQIGQAELATANKELELMRRNPGTVAAIVRDRQELAAVIEKQKEIETRALAVASVGRQAPVSNRNTGALSTVPVGATLPRTAVADVNQSVQRSLAQAAAASRATPEGLASINKSVQQAFVTTNAAAQANQSSFQRLYTWLHSRTSGVGGVGQAPPKLGQFLGQRALSTAAFAVSGGLLYGAVSAFKELITEANELQVQLGISESVFESFGGTVNRLNFDQYKENVIGISRETGVAADEVASVTRQLAGAFASIDENNVVKPDFTAGTEIGKTALELSKITGLPTKEIADAFSASVIAFTEDGDNAVQVANNLADAVVGLEARFGVSTTEVLNFTASLAPLASEMGFTLEQLAGFGAVVEQALGSDVAAAENIGRIFASLQKNIIPLAELLERGGIDTTSLVANLGQGDMPEALKDIIGAYDQIESNDALKQQIGVLIGGERQARTFFAVLDRGNQVLNALNTKSGDFDGAFDDRWNKYKETVTASFERMQRAVEEFGLALFDAGLVDALLALAKAGSGLADVGTILLDVFSELNSLFKGMPALILATALALKVLGAVGGAVGGRMGIKAGALGTVAGLANFFNPATVGGVSPLVKGPLQAGPAGYAVAAPVVNPRIGAYDPAANAKYGIRGLAAGNAGKVGAGIAGLAGSLAPAIAAVSVVAVISEMKSIAEETDQMRSDLRQQVRDQIIDGVSTKELRARIEPRKKDSQSFGSDLRNAITSGFGLFGDPKDDYSVALDEIQARESQEIGPQLELLMKEREDGVTKYLEDGLQQVVDKRSAPADLGGVEKRTSVEEIVANYQRDPENDEYAEAAAALVKAAGLRDSSLRDGFESISQGEENKLVAAQKAVDDLNQAASGELEASVTELEQLYDAGEASLDQLVNAYEASAELNRRVYQQLRVSSPEAALVALKAAVEAENNAIAVVKADVEKTAKISIDVLSALSDNPKDLIPVKQRQLAKTTDPDDRLAIALEIRDLQEQVLEQEASMIEDVDERIAFLNAGMKADPSGAELIVAQVTQIDPLWQQYLIETFGSIEVAMKSVGQAADLTIQNGIAFAINHMNVIIAEINRSRQAANKLLTDLAKVYNASQLAAIEAYIGGSLDTAEAGVRQEAMKTLSFPDPGGARVTGNTTDLERQKREQAAQDAEQKAEEARREAQARANAILDVQAAAAGGDAIALAQIARERARIAGQFAKTESEKISAFAQMVEADNQMRAAILARNEAVRDMYVALSDDDPVKAAEAAVANAMAALKAAKGAEEGAAAYAALIRAVKSQKDAILALADAQTDILIAMAESTGDTVKAAQLGLQKIQRQLARTDLNSTERAGLEAQRIAAEAGVRDARLSEERATIDYQLAIGDITKQQAIGALQSLLTIPELTEEQIREINLAIKDLKSQLGADFQFNLPTQLGLPTVYEVRRLGQSGGTGGGYQDNREINVTVNAETNATPESIASAVASVVGDPSRVGTTSKRF